MKKFTNKLAVVTGGTSGIGYASAADLVAQGAEVIVTGRDPEAVAQTAADLKVTGIVSDQGNLAEIDKLVAQIQTNYDHIDVLFINAGVIALAPFGEITEAQFDSNLDINFKGAFFTLQKFLPLLHAGSAVTFLTSVNASAGMPNTSVYGPSKAALLSLMKIAAYELAPLGIRVNAVSPGPIATALVSKTGFPQEALDQFAENMQQRVPQKRFGEAQEVAKLVSFLSSSDAAFITGAEFTIDGGVSINPILG
jgi:NAD(P)-dependent dehydrogenase (short-subunit alcohol dehydrogenase family)